MRFFQNAILALCAVATICTAGACKKNDNPAPTDTGNAPVVAAPEPAPAQPKPAAEPWDATKPNSLFPYVPVDSMFVVASTRKFDIHAENMKQLMSNALESAKADLESVLASL